MLLSKILWQNLLKICFLLLLILEQVFKEKKKKKLTYQCEKKPTHSFTESFRIYHRWAINWTRSLWGKVNKKGIPQDSIFFNWRNNMWPKFKILLKSFVNWHNISMVKENFEQSKNNELCELTEGWTVLSVAFKWLHDFNYSFHNKQLCEHLFQEVESCAFYGTCSWIKAFVSCLRAILRKQMEMVQELIKNPPPIERI